MEWRKGPETLRAGKRLRVKQEGAVCELEIRDLTVEDAGEYSCVCGQEKTTATLTVRGKDHAWPRGLVLGGRPSSLLPVPFPALLSLCPAPFPPIVTSSPCRVPVCSAAHVQVGPFKVTVRVCVHPQQVGPVQLGFVSSLHCPHPAASVRSESVIVFVSVCPSPALPAKFTKGLRKEEAMEGATAKLCCELSKTAPVEWRKGPETLRTETDCG